MSVDFEAIAQRRRCDVSSLRLALPLLEQGYTPPFLARYRRDELGGLDESSLWALDAALQNERQIAQRRNELLEAWQQTPLRDPAIGQAIEKSNSLRMLARLARRLKSESGDSPSGASRLAVRLLNPQRGDEGDLAAIAASVDGIADIDSAVAGLDQALATRLAGDPRIIGAAVRWLVKHARVHIASISDPHVSVEGEDEAADEAEAADDTADSASDQPFASALFASQSPEVPASEPVASELPASPGLPEPSPVSAEPAVDGEPVGSALPASPTELASPTESAAQQRGPRPRGGEPSKRAAKAKKTREAKKKVSPRQRRRRWLVSVLKPLEHKRLPCDKLSAFQVVMLGRALRSQVAQCAFEYDPVKLVAEIQRVAAGLNRHFEHPLREIVVQYEARIREAAEAAWWDDLHERASARLVSITADHLRQHVNRGPVEAKVVMAIDAVGPRTAATAIVAADGRMLHSEDLPCQLSASQRSQTVSRMGELIHAYHVDLIVVSNGPARRATMIALGDLIEQSPERTVRWTLADRSGADAYASSSIANDEMRSTPRRFRAAAWLAFAVLQPAQALAKVDPLKLRLSSFQRELSDDALSGSLRDVMISGASRGGVDANSAPVSWLSRLPGVTTKVATAIDVARRGALFSSRTAVGELEQWESAIHRRQAIPFLRVFGSEEVLDGTLIHPEDYALAKKLAAALGIELPPAAPPGYAPPDYASRQETAAPPQLADSTAPPAPMEVKDFTAAGESVSEFVVEGASPAEGATDPVAPLEAAAEPEMSVAEPAQPAQAEPPQEASSAVAASEAGEALSHETAPADAPQPSAPSLIPDPIRRPRPERVKIDKCIKEWQIGARRAEQLVQWLCDPFGDSDSTGSPPAVLSTMPTAKALKPGDQVIGVIVGVMPFGVFVELAPDCSGLVHVSRVSDSFVEDLHEAVQVGDVITAWVSGVDDKRRRVALSAVSPEREAEMEAAKRLVQEERHPRGGPRRRPEHAQAPATGQSRGGETRADRGPQGGEGQARTGQARGGQARGGQARAGQSQVGPGSRRGPSGGGEQAGGRPREASRGGRSRDRDSRGGARRDKKPESYRVVSKQEATPITDAMQKGEEPLRSFGDLLQFFGKKTVPARPKPGDSEAAPPETAPPDAADSGDLANSAVQQAVAAADAEPRVTAAVSQSQPAPADTDAGPPAQPAPPEDATAR